MNYFSAENNEKETFGNPISIIYRIKRVKRIVYRRLLQSSRSLLSIWNLEGINWETCVKIKMTNLKLLVLDETKITYRVLD